MAKGQGKGAMEEHVQVLQYVIYVFNTIFFCIGAAVFSVGVWIRFNEYTIDYVKAVDLQFYWTGTSMLMVGASLVMINSFIACCGAFFEKPNLLLIYKVATVITFLILLGGSAYVLDYGMEDSKVYPYLQETIRNLIYQYQWDITARRSVDIIQEQVGCCGGYGASDYYAINLPVPDTCRDQVTGNQYIDSCAEIFAQYVEARTAWITGLSLCLCFLQLFAVMFSFCMWQGIRESYKERSRN